MSNIGWSDLDNNKTSRQRGYCAKPNCICQKQITFTPKPFQMEGAGL